MYPWVTLRPVHSDSVRPSKTPMTRARSLRSRATISSWEDERKAVAWSSRIRGISRSVASGGTSLPARVPAKRSRYASVTSTMWPTTSRTCQWPAAVPHSQLVGSEASSSSPAASSRTTRSRLALLAALNGFHSSLLSTMVAIAVPPMNHGAGVDGSRVPAPAGGEHVVAESAPRRHLDSGGAA